MCLARMLTPEGLRELAEVAERNPSSPLDAQRLYPLADRMQLAGEGARPDGTIDLSGATIDEDSARLGQRSRRPIRRAAK